MTGLDPVWEERFASMLTDPASFSGGVPEVIGCHLVGYYSGSANARWSPPEPWSLPGHGFVFGGAAASVLEMVTGLACATLLSGEEYPAAIRLTQDFVRPVLSSHVYAASAEVTTRTGRLLFCSSRILDETGETVVLGSGVCQILRT